MRRLYQRITDLEHRIGEVDLQAKLRFPPHKPKPPPAPSFQFPPGYYLPENRRRFEELDAKIRPGLLKGTDDIRALTLEERGEWNTLFRMGFKTRVFERARD